MFVFDFCLTRQWGNDEHCAVRRLWDFTPYHPRVVSPIKFELYLVGDRVWSYLERLWSCDSFLFAWSHMASNGPRRVTACHSRDQDWPPVLYGTFTMSLDTGVGTRFKNQVYLLFFRPCFILLMFNILFGCCLYPFWWYYTISLEDLAYHVGYSVKNEHQDFCIQNTWRLQPINVTTQLIIITQ